MNLGEEEDVKARNIKVKTKQSDLDSAITAIMSHPQTRAWMYELLSQCGVYRTSFSRSALEMSFNEGARDVGLKITSEIMRVAPDSYTQMVREAGMKKDD